MKTYDELTLDQQARAVTHFIETTAMLAACGLCVPEELRDRIEELRSAGGLWQGGQGTTRLLMDAECRAIIDPIAQQKAEAAVYTEDGEHAVRLQDLTRAMHAVLQRPEVYGPK